MSPCYRLWLMCGSPAMCVPEKLVLDMLFTFSVNVQLSLDETYADVVPVRYNSSSPSAFV